MMLDTRMVIGSNGKRAAPLQSSPITSFHIFAPRANFKPAKIFFLLVLTFCIGIESGRKGMRR